MLPGSHESWSPIGWRMDLASSVCVPLLQHDRSGGPGCHSVRRRVSAATALQSIAQENFVRETEGLSLGIVSKV